MRFVALALVAACSSPRATPTAQPAYQATIRWTSYGIPHVEARDLRGIAFGQGYATAAMNACVLLDQIVKVRSERARYFGPEHADSDFGWLALGVMETAQRELPAASANDRALAAGFATGFNKYLAEGHALPPDCAGKPWVKPIAEVELAAYWLSVGMIGSSGYFIDGIARAQPGASNGWGIGAERSATGGGMLVANPHFPWEGELRFFESHVTIPGDLDAYGANLIGLPLVSIGFTRHHAWTHTFSSSSRFVLYRLALDPADPTKYRYGSETRALVGREHVISVKQPDGSLREEKRTLYRSHHGPIVQTGPLAWTREHAFAIRDVTRNRSMFEQHLAMIRARSLDEFRAAFAQHQGTPFLNTVYADAEGNAFYIDGSAVPDLPEAGLGMWRMGLRMIPELRAAWERGLVVLDGSNPVFELATDNPVRPGAISTARAPQLVRRDYVLNANDSYWLTNPDQRLTGFSPFYGEAERQPSARTRMNHSLVRGYAKHTHERLKELIFSNRAMTSELLRAQVVDRCLSVREVADACRVLADWTDTYHVTSKGAVLWRELLAALPDDLWRVPFDPEHPLDTPRDLADVDVVAALGKAIAQLRAASIAPDAALGDVQYTVKGGKRYPVPGSTWAEGSANPSVWQDRDSTLLPSAQRGELVNAETGLTRHGYPVNYGSSFVLVVSYEAGGPRADAILTSSQSTDPRSPHFADQTARYGTADPWRPVLFTRAQIDADRPRVQQISAP